MKTKLNDVKIGMDITINNGYVHLTVGFQVGEQDCNELSTFLCLLEKGKGYSVEISDES